MLGKLYTTAEVAEMAGVSRNWVTQNIEKGHLYANKAGNQWFIDESDAQEWLESRKIKVPIGTLTTGTAAKMLHKSRPGIAYMCKTGKLNCKKVSERRLLVVVDDLFMSKLPPEERPF